MTEHVLLGDIIDIASGQVDPRIKPYCDLPHVGGDNIESDNGRLFGLRTARELSLMSGKYAFGPDDVLYSKIRPALNKVALPDFSGICSADMYPLRARTDLLDRRYLAQLLRHNKFLAYAIKQSTRTNIPKINRDALLAYELILPPVPVQRRIAEILDKADALRIKRRAALTQLDTLTQSIFLDMFGDPATNRKGWRQATLGDVVVEFRYGTSNKSTGQGKPALRIPNVAGGTIDLTVLKRVPVDSAEFERLRLRDGDLLFVRTNGNPDFVGRCAVFESTIAAVSGFDGHEFIFASYLIRARLRTDGMRPEFLRAYLLGAEGRRQLRSRSKTSAGQFNINTESLGSIPVPLPPIELQRDFARRVVAMEELKTLQRTSQAELDALFASLQHRAFRGEL